MLLFFRNLCREGSTHPNSQTHPLTQHTSTSSVEGWTRRTMWTRVHVLQRTEETANMSNPLFPHSFFVWLSRRSAHPLLPCGTEQPAQGNVHRLRVVRPVDSVQQAPYVHQLDVCRAPNIIHLFFVKAEGRNGGEGERVQEIVEHC